MSVKLGLDIHGVIDTNPDIYVNLAKAVLSDNGEVHIITGARLDNNLIHQLLSYNKGNKFWTKLVSIEGELIKNNKPLRINKFNRPEFEDYIWNSFKGKYCRDNNITYHYDDSPEYGIYFDEGVFKLVIN